MYYNKYLKTANYSNVALKQGTIDICNKLSNKDFGSSINEATSREKYWYGALNA